MASWYFASVFLMFFKCFLIITSPPSLHYRLTKKDERKKSRKNNSLLFFKVTVSCERMGGERMCQSS